MTPWLCKLRITCLPTLSILPSIQLLEAVDVMDLRWFQDFLTLAECGQFTTAAELRHVSQPAFSRRIQALEHWVGAALVDRGCFPVRLTTAGEQFRANAAEIVRKVVDARGEASEIDSDAGVLRIAMPHCLATARFPAWCNEWTAAGAAASLRLHVGNVHDSAEALAATVVDLLVCFRHAAEDIQLDPQTYMRVLVEADTLRLYRPASMKMDESQLVADAPHTRYPYVAYAQGTYFKRLTELAGGDVLQRSVLRRVCEMDFVDGARDLVRAGVGMAWLPQSSAAQAVALGDIVPVTDKRFSVPMEVCMYARRHVAPDSPVARVFKLFTR